MNTSWAYEIVDMRGLDNEAQRLGPMGVVDYIPGGLAVKACNRRALVVDLANEPDDSNVVQDQEEQGRLVFNTETGPVVLTKLTLRLYREKVAPFVPSSQLFSGDDDCNEYWVGYLKDAD